MDDEKEIQKSHKKAKTGAKAKKKNSKNNQYGDQKNPKAFAIQSVNKTIRRVHHVLDLRTKKHHIPIVNRVPDEPPPIVVAIVGPPKVGKTTLMQCIVKNYSRQRLANMQGPVTVVTGKNRRITLIECENDINCMIDIAKVADLVLLLVDATFGFEMEIFEFLNICQVHGFPRIMGILTHLDSFKEGKVLQRTKKRLKSRFWTEIYKGAKLFYLSGMVFGEYQKNEIHNLCRFISVMKFRPLEWRLAHPYVVADRMEDITHRRLIEQDSKCDRAVSLYGYVRGALLKGNAAVHIPGCGDYELHNVEFLSDPCPTPEREKKRSLDAKERLVYAPMSGVGGIVYDKDAVYIDVGHAKSGRQAQDGPSNELVANMMSMNDALDQRMGSSHMTVFTDTQPLTSRRDGDTDGDIDGDTDGDNLEEPNDSGMEDDSEGSGNDSDEDEDNYDENTGDEPKRVGEITEDLVYGDDDNSDDESDDDIRVFSSTPPVKKVIKDRVDGKTRKEGKRTEQQTTAATKDDDDDDDDDSCDEHSEDDKIDSADEDAKESEDGSIDEEEEEEEDSLQGDLKWKGHMVERAAELFRETQRTRRNYSKIVYGQEEKEEVPAEESDELGGLFHVLKMQSDESSQSRILRDGWDCSRCPSDTTTNQNIEELLEMIRDCFVTGKWESTEDAQTLLDRDDELYGDFEDLETGEVHKSGEKAGENSGEEDEDDAAGNEDVDVEKKKTRAEMTTEERRMAKKKKVPTATLR